MACCNHGPIQRETCKQLPCMSLEKRTGVTFAFTSMSTCASQKQGRRQDPHFTDVRCGLPHAHRASRMSSSLPASVHVHRPGLFLNCHSEHVLGYSLVKDVSSPVRASLRNNDL